MFLVPIDAFSFVLQSKCSVRSLYITLTPVSQMGTKFLVIFQLELCKLESISAQ